MNRICVSAPGKIHLMGEHAVVYSKPALLSAINLRLIVAVNSRPGLEARAPQIYCPQSPELVVQSIELIKKQLQVVDAKPLHVAITSDILPGFHLGSSAAVAVALSGALLKFYTDRFDKKEINDIAYEVEKMFHGTPSGGDNTTVTYGGFVRFVKKLETEKEFISMYFPQTSLFNHFYLINTGKPESTKDMVASVRTLFEQDQIRKEKILNANEQATLNVIDALTKGDEQAFIQGIMQGEKTLEDMGVVSDKVKPLIRLIEKNQGAAKILGGGGHKDGVGFLLCYHTNQEQISNIVKPYDYPIINIQLGEEGVRIEE